MSWFVVRMLGISVGKCLRRALGLGIRVSWFGGIFGNGYKTGFGLGFCDWGDEVGKCGGRVGICLEEWGVWVEGEFRGRERR